MDGVYAYQLAPQFVQISGSTGLNKYLKDLAAPLHEQPVAGH